MAEIDDPGQSLTDLPAAFLYSLAEAFWEDGKDLARLITTCKELRSVCDKPVIWRQLVLKRFGPNVVPGMRPAADEALPAQLPGWVFYQGRDGSEESDQHHPEAADNVQQLKQLAKGAEAFTTSGTIIQVLHKPQTAWKHSSFHPKQGMYVRQDVVEAGDQQEPRNPIAGTEWPPEVPGWTYFPSCVSDGYTLGSHESNDSLSRHKQLKDLLRAHVINRKVVAIATSGEVKTRVRPQACWTVHPSYDVGLYVKSDVAAALRLVQPPPVPDYRALYAKLDKLRLDAANMWAVWLNGNYLQLVEDPDSPADSGMALQLKQVWWLELGGSIPGVAPGQYEVCWVVDASQTRWQSPCKINMSAEVQPASPVANPSSSSGGGDGAPSSSSAASSDAQPSEPVTVEYSYDLIDQLQQQHRRSNAKWVVISAGVLQVTQYSTVNLRFWSTDNTYKQNMAWACAELKLLSTEQRPRVSNSRRAAVRALGQPAASGSWGLRVGDSRLGDTNVGRNVTAAVQQVPLYPEMGPLGGIAQWFMHVLGGYQNHQGNGQQ